MRWWVRWQYENPSNRASSVVPLGGSLSGVRYQSQTQRSWPSWKRRFRRSFRRHPQSREGCLEYVRKARKFIRNALSALTLTIAKFTRLTWTCILALLVESRKGISEDRPRRRLDHRERPAMPDRVIHVIVVGIICLVDHDRVFPEASNAPTPMETYVLTCTSDLFRSMRTFATLVQTCIVRCALGGISNACGASGRYKSVRAPSLFILPLLSFVPFLFPPTGRMVRLSTFVSTAAWSAGLYIVYRREAVIRR